ncbi:PQQ-dependent sugar dehydrogenase [Defluviimonas sp. WL0002]|uniref:PQQ-dependent sugar dehydrogenase n=1 Tax=Albidovulum marisflavi TaxID=2984159 RepID=A0ABT2Z7F9_9RHOB|nr:PQQ-dependent sugar dehydrogenase [Defluviimonas sp. WL0002]MCV2867074.1 PQQ-dependent sugar dehydrogenase [Defluviimonas sp. WL0002]
MKPMHALTSAAALCAIILGTNAAAFAQPVLTIEPLASFDRPWAVATLPQGGFLVTEKPGRLVHVTRTGNKQPISGVPGVTASGQVGLHDIALAPDFESSGLIYLTWVDGSAGGALHLGRGRIDLARAELSDFGVLWQATPSGGNGHPGAMMTFSDDGQLFLTSGDRQLGDPAQDLTDSRGKILRLASDGQAAPGNPFAEAPEVWTLGHRNPYGIAFDGQGRLWSHEMGPRGGDELNLIEPGRNYGWPLVSEGRQYSGFAIPDHDTRPDLAAPVIKWSPVIAPAGMIYYDGAVFPEWQGSFLIGGLRSQALVRVELDGTSAREAERWDMGNRIRDVVADEQGEVYLLEDGDGGRLLRLVRQD